MATPPITSPFFSLPNEDGIPHDQYPDTPLQPITLSCASCERIVGDSSAFLCATRQMGTVTLERMVSVEVGREGLKTSLEGEWDEFCNYKHITCAKCASPLGKMYFATTSKLSSLQNKYTVYISALSIYHHGSPSPSLPVAATQEIYQQLHPSPEALAESIDHIMTMCVMLREEQGDIIRELKKLGLETGVEVILGEDDDKSPRFEDEAGREWKEKLESLEEKVKILENLVKKMKNQEKEVVERWEKKEKEESEERNKLRQEWFKFLREAPKLQAQPQTQMLLVDSVAKLKPNGHLLPLEKPESHPEEDTPTTDPTSPPEPPQQKISTLGYKRKRGSLPDSAPPSISTPPTSSAIPQQYSEPSATTTSTDPPSNTPGASNKTVPIDLSPSCSEETSHQHPHSQRKPAPKPVSKKEVPNSQSADEALENEDEVDEVDEERIKSPEGKRRRRTATESRVRTGERKVNGNGNGDGNESVAVVVGKERGEGKEKEVSQRRSSGRQRRLVK